jgi:hypothetical protein
MRNAALALALLSACGGAQPSQWATSKGERIECECNGIERLPKPHEASSAGDAIDIRAVCEGKVSKCGLPRPSPSYKGMHQLD